MDQGGHGMIPAGKYVHRATGQTIFVRDSVQDGEHLLVITDKGQITMKEFSEYIQVEDGEDIYIPNMSDLYGKKPTGQPNQELLARINQGIDAEDRIKVSSDSNKNVTGETTITQEKPKAKNKNYDLIKKVFDKFPLERTINFEIVEEEWPFKEFNMLVNVLDVPLKDICDYVIENFLDKDHLSESLSKYFEEHM